MHPSQETLSAYADAELAAEQSASLERHVKGCVPCGLALRAFEALDRELGATAALACERALSLVSASQDGELDEASARVAAAHLATCAACGADAAGWADLDAALAALPLVQPSARVDAALEKYRRAPVAGRRRPLFGMPAWPARGAAAIAVAIAVLLAIPQQIGPDLATPETALVASIQQTVLYPATGTLYVVRADEGTVAALDAVTLAQRTVIAVGGRPTALALDAQAEQILVLDAQAKTLTAIDGKSNTVVGATEVEIPGTPTSLQVDGSGKVVVASIIGGDVAGSGGGPAPSQAIRTPAPQSGAVTIIDRATKQVQTISQVDVAPRQVVIEASGKRALLVSAQGTTIVDAATYKTLDRTAGGIAAAFSGSTGDFAILSLRSGAAFVTFSSRPGVALAGVPRAITPMPDGGYAVLTEFGGQGRITTLAADGTLQAAIDAPAGRDLTFDALDKNFAVIGASGVSVVAVPSAVAAVPSASPDVTVSPRPAQSPAIGSVPPQANVKPSASPSAPASASPSTSPAASPSVTPVANASPAVAVSPAPEVALVPTGARLLTGTTYLYAPERLAGKAVAGDATRIWTLDLVNRLSALHMGTGEVFSVAKLPIGAHISMVLPSPGYVYLTDPTAGKLYVVTIRTDQVASYAVPFLSLVTAAVTSPDDRLWLIVDGLGLVSFEPRTQHLDVADVGPSKFSAVGVDPLGRVWLAPRDRAVADLYDPLSGKLTELSVPHDGAITSILGDEKGATWVATSTGQIFAMRNGKLETSAFIGKAIDRLVQSSSGDVWYVSRAGGDVTFGPADGSAPGLHGPDGMSTPTFDSLGRAWAQDSATGAFFVTLPAGGR